MEDFALLGREYSFIPSEKGSAILRVASNERRGLIAIIAGSACYTPQNPNSGSIQLEKNALMSDGYYSRWPTKYGLLGIRLSKPTYVYTEIKIRAEEPITIRYSNSQKSAGNYPARNCTKDYTFFPKKDVRYEIIAKEPWCEMGFHPITRTTLKSDLEGTASCSK